MCQSGQGTTILVMYVLEAGFYSLNFELHTKFELQNAKKSTKCHPWMILFSFTHEHWICWLLLRGYN
jgi:hypothetical protein